MIPLKRQRDFRIRYKHFKLLFIEDHILPKFCVDYRFKWDQKPES